MIKAKKLEVGIAVFYTSGNHGESKHNPLWGGRYGQTVGLITGFTEVAKDPSIRVEFPSLGTSNVYRCSDLTLVEELEEEEEPKRQVQGLFNV